MKGIKLKIARAKEHMAELRVELDTFLRNNPYKVSVKRDKVSRRPVYFVSEALEVPEKIPLIIGEVIQNLRSALDNTAYWLFSKTSNGDGGKIYFPISEDIKKYEEEKGKRTEGISQEARDLIDSFLPYKGGNDVLWQIHKLNNIDKHRLLVTVGASFGGLNLGAVMTQYMKKTFPDQVGNFPGLPPMFLNPADKLFPLKVGDQLFIAGPDAEEIPNMQFRIDVLLSEPGIIEGYPIQSTLEGMIEETEKIISAFEAKFS